MSKAVKSMAAKAALPPGSPVYVGPPSAGVTDHTIYRFGPDFYAEEEDGPIRPPDRSDPSAVVWVRVRGIDNPQSVARIGRDFGLHSLVVEDLLNTSHRPKMEEYEDYLFVVSHWAGVGSPGDEIPREQVGLILGDGWVISFEESLDSRVFSPMVKRLKNNRGRVRRMGADYLAYALLDLTVDSYFTVLESLDALVDELESEIMVKAIDSELNNIHRLRRQAMRLRRELWPMREMAGLLVRDPGPQLSENVQPFLKDLYDHTVHALEASEALRDNLSALMELCLGQAGYRMNQVMKVLTVVGAIFMPLTFLAGLYGMNFKHMPELELPWAYPVLIGLMVGVVGGMIYLFKRKDWI